MIVESGAGDLDGDAVTRGNNLRGKCPSERRRPSVGSGQSCPPDQGLSDALEMRGLGPACFRSRLGEGIRRSSSFSRQPSHQALTF